MNDRELEGGRIGLRTAFTSRAFGSMEQGLMIKMSCVKITVRSKWIVVSVHVLLGTQNRDTSIWRNKFLVFYPICRPNANYPSSLEVSNDHLLFFEEDKVYSCL